MGPEHTGAFNAAKNEIIKAPTLEYYDSKKETTIQTDASKYGLGATLLQNGKCVTHVSKALQQYVISYVAIEKEALTIARAMEKLCHFLYAQKFSLETDQKPLEIIINCSIVKANPKLQGVIIHFVPYDFTTKCIKGKSSLC